MMKTTLFPAIAAAALLILPAQAQNLEKVWEVSGLANPESALWDPDHQVIYVSNVNGSPTAKDGNGFISTISPDGKLLTGKWAAGLDAPKGLALSNGRLYVSDIDRLVAIDTATGKVSQTWTAPGAKFLNDVTAGETGHVYVSDMLDDAIWRLADGKFEKWLADPGLESPNGLKADKDRLLVAAWGPLSGDGFATSKPGRLKSVNIAGKTVSDLGPGFGNLDGLEPDGQGGWLVTDWMNGGLFRADNEGHAVKLLSLEQGSADIGVIPDQKLVLIPMMVHGKLEAYRIP